MKSRFPGRVLAVDDDAVSRDAAEAAEEADHWLGSQRFDVCLLDIELPRMSGVEFLIEHNDRAGRTAPAEGSPWPESS